MSHWVTGTFAACLLGLPLLCAAQSSGPPREAQSSLEAIVVTGS